MRRFITTGAGIFILCLGGSCSNTNQHEAIVPDVTSPTTEKNVDKNVNNKNTPEVIEPVASSLKGEQPATIAKCSKLMNTSPIIDKLADKTNYGMRHNSDFKGRSLVDTPQLIVIHETVMGGPETIALFQTPHPRDEDQGSYHMLIERDGSRIQVVPDANRAYGAGMSAFGDVTQKIKEKNSISINNIALHISLVSPKDGLDNSDAHSGYSDAQYETLAQQVLLWQATYGIPMARVTTHQAVDRSHSRYDPRSFRWDHFDSSYQVAARICGLEKYDSRHYE